MQVPDDARELSAEVRAYYAELHAQLSRPVRLGRPLSADLTLPTVGSETWWAVLAAGALALAVGIALA